MANIFVNRQPVGTLSREDPLNRFAYDAAVPPSLGVSLLMPVAAGPYVAERSGVLHPVFDMNLPEGALRDAVSIPFTVKTRIGFDSSEVFSELLPIFAKHSLDLLTVHARTVKEMSELDQMIRRNLGLNPRGGSGSAGSVQIDISILNNTKADVGGSAIPARNVTLDAEILNDDDDED